MFDYRPLDDPKQVLLIAQSAFALRFAERQSVEDWVKTSLDQGRELFGVYAGDRLLAAYMLYSYSMRLRRSVVPMGGIGLLCSRLDARGQGAVRHMIKGSLETMHAKGHVVSVLDPFSESFYRTYGWEKLTRLKVIEVSPGAIQLADDPETHIQAVDLFYPDAESMAFYNAYARSHHTLVQRGHAEWAARTALRSWNTDTAARGVVRFSDENQVVGLMGYDLLRKEDDEQATFAVNLMAYEEDAVLHAMLRYLRALSHQVSVVRVDLPLDGELWPYLSQRPEKSTVREMLMIRIVSMEALDGLLLDAPNTAVEVAIEDLHAPWNAGVWHLSVESGVLCVRRGHQADIRCGIGAVSCVLSGFASFGELIAAGKVEALDSYRSQDLPKTVPFLVDYF